MLAPLLVAAPAVQFHASSAMSAFALGLFSLPHERHAGPSHARIWVALMLVVSLSVFLIHQLRLWGREARSICWRSVTLVMLPLAVLAARHHVVSPHRRCMIAIFVGGLEAVPVHPRHLGRYETVATAAGAVERPRLIGSP